MSRAINQFCRHALVPLMLSLSALVMAQGTPPLGEGPFVFQTAQVKIQVEVVARGMEHPWSLAFLPSGDMLVTERAGNLRVIHNGVLNPESIAGVPDVYVERLLGFMEVIPHPDFAQNRTLYLTYHKKITEEPKAIATVLASAIFDGTKLTDVKELLVGDSWDGAGGAGARLAFGSDGKLYMSLGASRDDSAQQPGLLRGKILRLNDDGSVPSDNPFVGKEGFRPEIFSWGHRNISGLAVNPATGALWASEYGPNGGDEVNIISAGKNYGWPLVSFGRDYPGPFISPVPYKEGMENPVATFIPGISPSGLAFYTGTDFPIWTTSAFLGATRVGQIGGTGKMVRIFFDENGNERQREDLLVDLHQRIRDIRMGPDGLMYMLTEEQDGALLVIKPVNE